MSSISTFCWLMQLEHELERGSSLAAEVGVWVRIRVPAWVRVLVWVPVSLCFTRLIKPQLSFALAAAALKLISSCFRCKWKVEEKRQSDREEKSENERTKGIGREYSNSDTAQTHCVMAQSSGAILIFWHLTNLKQIAKLSELSLSLSVDPWPNLIN